MTNNKVLPTCIRSAIAVLPLVWGIIFLIITFAFLGVVFLGRVDITDPVVAGLLGGIITKCMDVIMSISAYLYGNDYLEDAKNRARESSENQS